MSPSCATWPSRPIACRSRGRASSQGTGKPNPKGLAFYDRLFDALLEAGITPWVTLFHWDLPNALQRRGGFQNRDMVEWFGDYAALIADKYGDRIKHFMTINEPPCVVGLGLQEGMFAPGYKLPYAECLNAAHNLLLAHGRADSQLPIETSARPHAQRLLESGYDLTLQPFDGDHVIVPWVVARAIEFFLGPAPA